MVLFCGIRFLLIFSMGSFWWGIFIVGEKNEYLYIWILVRLDKIGKYIYVLVG